MSNLRICFRPAAVAACATGFDLDFLEALVDNTNGLTITVLIYSPSDTPQGLRRGSVFSGAVQGVSHAR